MNVTNKSAVTPAYSTPSGVNAFKVLGRLRVIVAIPSETSTVNVMTKCQATRYRNWGVVSVHTVSYTRTVGNTNGPDKTP